MTKKRKIQILLHSTKKKKKENNNKIYLYLPTGSNFDDQRITVLSAAPDANSLPFLAAAKQKTISLCPKNKSI